MNGIQCLLESYIDRRDTSVFTIAASTKLRKRETPGRALNNVRRERKKKSNKMRVVRYSADTPISPANTAREFLRSTRPRCLWVSRTCQPLAQCMLAAFTHGFWLVNGCGSELFTSCSSSAHQVQLFFRISRVNLTKPG